MSAVVELVQNKSGSWTARGQYGGVYAEVTCATRYQAVAALDKALHAFDSARNGASCQQPQAHPARCGCEE